MTDIGDDVSSTPVEQADPEKLWASAIVECKKIEIDSCNTITGWATAAQASNLTASTIHVEGTHSLEFDKDGEEGTDGYIEKTISSLNIGDFQTHSIGHTKVYLSDVSQVSKVFIRLGTDSSNYFQYDFTILEDGWNDLDMMISHRTSQAGVGADLSDVTYIAAGVVMNANGNTLTDIRVDSIHVKRMLEALAFGAPSIELASRIRLQDNNTGRMLEINASHEALVHDGDANTALGLIKDTDGIKKITDAVTVISMNDILETVQKIDNQEDSIIYARFEMSTGDDILIEPDPQIRVHHIYVNNASAGTVIFHLADDETPKFSFCLAPQGGTVAQNLKRPWDLSEGKALMYDYVSGTFPVVFITIGYEQIMP